jgi:hypothetical protein
MELLGDILTLMLLRITMKKSKKMKINKVKLIM